MPLSAKIQGSKKTGIDYSENYIAWAKEKHADKGIEFLHMDANNLQLEHQYDLIIISNLIGFVDDIQHVFEEVKKCCHPNTKVIVQYYNSIWEPLIKLSETLGLKQKTPTQNWLSTRDINNLLYISGFEVYRNNKRLIFPFYLPIISSLLNKYLAKFPIFRFFSFNIYSFAKPLSDDKPEDYANKYSTTVVIPARNESGNIENAILRLPKFGKHIEIIFVEGNSTDDTWEKIQEIQKKYAATHDIKIAQQKGKGKADAVREGYKIATGDILMILDADLTVPPEDLPKFYNAIAGGKGDFINGTRLVYPMDKEAMRFLNYLGNHFFSWAFTWLLEQRFKDTLCGTKVMFRTDYIKLTKNRTYFGDFDPFGDFDLLFGAHKLNLKIVEVPIRYRERTYGSTNISRFKHGLILLRMCAFASRKCKFI
ncbi:MAG: bifunctional class I SAM-dependent methyltransferase/glycosyltransferase family 2 protein [Bacteroidia bacterium]|nr:bifunctional class I SAM-dependent methyltransferase/glycosyltransferase family 2 protein [Bacteroidia bacterium]